MKIDGNPRNAAFFAARNAAREENLEWMAMHGETVEGAAAREGVGASAIEWWCTRHGRRDLWDRLNTNSNRPGTLPYGRLTIRLQDTA